MSEANDNITYQPDDDPRRDEFTGKRRRRDDYYDPDRPAPPPPKSKAWIFVVLGVGLAGLLLCCPVAGFLLLIPAVQKVREAAARTQSQNNLHLIGIAMHSSGDSNGGLLPPSNGPYPGDWGPNGSFFFHLLPYVEQDYLYSSVLGGQPMPDTPVLTYVAPADSRNPANNSTISYCTNGTVFMNKPNMPGTFINGTSNSICVMERSGLDGAHKWTNTNNVLGSPGNPPAFPQIGASPPAYVDGSPQGFTSAGCAVLLADGSVRTIKAETPSTWKWACDPTNIANAPPDW